MKRWLLACAALWLTAEAARADIVVYTVPQTGITVTLEGTMKVIAVPGGEPLISFTSPATGTLKLQLSEVSDRIECPTTAQKFNKMFNKAKKDAPALMEASEWALKRGLLKEFRECVKQAHTLDPANEEAKRLADLIEKIDNIDLGESTEQENILRNKIGALKNMEIRKSKHFILYHNTNKAGKDAKKDAKKGDRAARRLDLLEKVYESFLFKFYSKGVNLEIPKERLMVVLFDDEKQFRNYSEMLSPSLSMAAGFWSHIDNIAVFYDHGGTEDFKALQQLNRALQEQKETVLRGARQGDKYVAAADIVRRAEALDKLFNMWQENEDITVVSHECTHQMAGNTGLLPRHVMVPSWVHEGLATYFECPKDATWSGIGAVNEDRLEWYQALARNQKEYSSLEWIVSDQIFDLTTNHAGKLHAYGQAWALTHFMLEQHPQEMLAFYNKLGKLPPDVVFSPETLHKTFDETVKIDRDKLTREWRDYMDELKTDVARMLEDNGADSD